MKPIHRVAPISRMLFILVRSPKSSIGTRMERAMIIPPIVGVPFLLSCPSRPRSRISSPICLACSFFMMTLPDHRAVTMATRAQQTTLNEM